MTGAGSTTVEVVRDIVDTQLKLADHGYRLGPDDDLWALGMSSLNTVGLMLAIEDTFQIEFSEDLLNEGTFRSVSTIATAVDNSQLAASG